MWKWKDSRSVKGRMYEGGARVDQVEVGHQLVFEEEGSHFATLAIGIEVVYLATWCL
jgi:hypothetical protein